MRNPATSPAENGFRLPSRAPSRRRAFTALTFSTFLRRCSRLPRSGTSCTCGGCTSSMFPDAQEPKPASTQLSCSIPVIHGVCGGLLAYPIPCAGDQERDASRQVRRPVCAKQGRREHTTCLGLRLASAGLGSSSCHPPTASANPLHRPAGLRVALFEQPWSKP